MNDLPVQQKLIDIGCDPVASLLDLLLKDKSTHKNIIWATDMYESLGHGFTDKEQIDIYFCSTRILSNREFKSRRKRRQPGREKKRKSLLRHGCATR